VLMFAWILPEEQRGKNSAERWKKKTQNTIKVLVNELWGCWVKKLLLWEKHKGRRWERDSGSHDPKQIGF